MRHKDALQIAYKLREELAPFCDRIEIGGSLRRQDPDIKDIELICIPKMKAGIVRSKEWVNKVFSLGEIRKGTLGQGKYIKIYLPERINLDLFIATPNNWGMIYLIRTGSASFVRNILFRFNRRGYSSEGGYPSNSEGEKLFFQEEEMVFNFLEMDFVDPVNR
ncbi:MAG: hypothetical protein KDC34_19140 [Saprospiraceae bacterium]|nr:hypothetical protein [Saprospiraceae bacterium]